MSTQYSLRRCPTLSCFVPMLLYVLVGLSVIDFPAINLAFWNVDEQGGVAALDNTSNGHHGTIIGATRVPGVMGPGALPFNGTIDRVEVGTFDTSTENLTVSMWVKWFGPNGKT